MVTRPAHALETIIRRSPAVLGLLLALATAAHGQTPGEDAPETPESGDAVPERVEVAPVADDAIEARLARILEATEWFQDVAVRADEGVVFLSGTSDTETHREWAGRLAANTEGVVAVVNGLEVAQTSMWDLSPAWHELRELAADVVRISPLIAVALVLLALTLWGARWSMRGADALLRRRLQSQLLREVAARAVAVPIFLLALYLVLKVSGLTRLAVTVLGGTGLVGLVIGFAFRDIAENFLASILISIQHPFATGDLIEVAGFKGFVQSVNTRSTLLMTLEGNHVQIPNATIYKETITNFTSNPHTRFDFAVGVGYDDSIAEAQSIALDVLKAHVAVIDDPEPLVLVESLGASTVNLRVYFWVDTGRYSGLKVRSAVIRLVKRAFAKAGISMPDEAREVVFPHGVPVRMIEEREQDATASVRAPRSRTEADVPAHSAEGELTSEAGEIEEQARHARRPESGRNLLDP